MKTSKSDEEVKSFGEQFRDALIMFFITTFFGYRGLSVAFWVMSPFIVIFTDDGDRLSLYLIRSFPILKDDVIFCIVTTTSVAIYYILYGLILLSLNRFAIKYWKFRIF